MDETIFPDLPDDPELYQEVICRAFGFPLEGYQKFLEHYMVMSRDEMLFTDDDPLDMNFDAIAEKAGMPKKILRKIQNTEVVGRPITNGDYDFLMSLKKLWGKPWFLRAQMVHMPKDQREKLIIRPELVEKWERWSYSSFMLNTIEYGTGNRMLNPKNRILIDDMAETVESIFGVPNCLNLRNRLKQIRKLAKNDKYRAKKENVPLAKMAMRRGVSLDHEP